MPISASSVHDIFFLSTKIYSYLIQLFRVWGIFFCGCFTRWNQAKDGWLSSVRSRSCSSFHQNLLSTKTAGSATVLPHHVAPSVNWRGLRLHRLSLLLMEKVCDVFLFFFCHLTHKQENKMVGLHQAELHTCELWLIFGRHSRNKHLKFRFFSCFLCVTPKAACCTSVFLLDPNSRQSFPSKPQ